MTESSNGHIPQEETILNKAEQEQVEDSIQRHLVLMQETNPSILEEEIRDLAQSKFGEDDVYVYKAIGIAKDLYRDYTRKHSPTDSILHPYRVTLAGDNSAPHKTIIKLLHDTAEDYDLSIDNMQEQFGSMGDLVAMGVDAFTKRHGESYATYLARLRSVAEAVPDLGHLVYDKGNADMGNNAIDPFGLPAHIPRGKKTRKAMAVFHDKIDTHAGEFLYRYPVVLEGVRRLVILGREANASPDLIIPSVRDLPRQRTIFERRQT